ncbi:MAG: hypothetical protein CMO81_11065 [Waddliaceae bacterium]|nr:hypothetical protein [Waddliaceae bacterium]
MTGTVSLPVNPGDMETLSWNLECSRMPRSTRGLVSATMHNNVGLNGQVLGPYGEPRAEALTGACLAPFDVIWKVGSLASTTLKAPCRFIHRAKKLKGLKDKPQISTRDLLRHECSNISCEVENVCKAALSFPIGLTKIIVPNAFNDTLMRWADRAEDQLFEEDEWDDLLSQ